MLERTYPHKERAGERFKQDHESLKKEISIWKNPPSQKPIEQTLQRKKLLEFQYHKPSRFSEEERQKICFDEGQRRRGGEGRQQHKKKEKKGSGGRAA